MEDFESHVIGKLATLEERTRYLPKLQEDMAAVKGRVKLLEFKAGLFGSLAAGVVFAIKYLFFGRHV